MRTAELTEILSQHHRWLKNKCDGERADLAGADLAGADLAGADLARAYLARANLARADLARANLARAYLARAYLAGADLENITVSWSDHTLLSELLWRAADTEARQMLAAFIGRRTDWCWDKWESWEHSERNWAITLLAGYVRDNDAAPKFIRLAAKREAAA